MELSACKICGERHRLGFCPKFNPDEERRRWQKGMQGEPLKKVSGANPEKRVDQSGQSPPAVASRDEPRPPANNSEGRKRGVPHPRDRDTSLSKLKPWKAQGLSRATWYRQQKKAARK